MSVLKSVSISIRNYHILCVSRIQKLCFLVVDYINRLVFRRYGSTRCSAAASAIADNFLGIFPLMCVIRSSISKFSKKFNRYILLFEYSCTTNSCYVILSPPWVAVPNQYCSQLQLTRQVFFPKCFFIVKQSDVYPLIDNIEKTLKRDHYDALCLKASATKSNLLKEQIMVTGMMSTFFPDYYSETSLLIAVLQISLARIKSDKQIYSFA